MRDKNIHEIINLYFQSIEVFKTMESSPRDFGSGDELYSSEVHTLAAIGNKPGINLTDLSLAMNVSKSAVSKFVKKLLDKDLIRKNWDEKNKKEVAFYVTSKGQAACSGHELFEKKTFGGIYELFEGMSVKEKVFMKDVLQKIMERLQSSMEKP